MRMFYLWTGPGSMLRSVKDRSSSSSILLLLLLLQTPRVVLFLKQTVQRFPSVSVTVEVEVVRGKKILGFLILNISLYVNYISIYQ